MEMTRSTEETKMDKTIRTASNHDKKSLMKADSIELVRQPCLVVSSFGTQQAEARAIM